MTLLALGVSLLVGVMRVVLPPVGSPAVCREDNDVYAILGGVGGGLWLLSLWSGVRWWKVLALVVASVFALSHYMPSDGDQETSVEAFWRDDDEMR